MRQRLTELGKIISKLEDVGDPPLVDLVAARKAEKEVACGNPSRRHNGSAGPGCTGQGCAQALAGWGRDRGIAASVGGEESGLDGGGLGARSGSAGGGRVGDTTSSGAGTRLLPRLFPQGQKQIHLITRQGGPHCEGQGEQCRRPKCLEQPKEEHATAKVHEMTSDATPSTSTRGSPQRHRRSRG